MSVGRVFTLSTLSLLLGCSSSGSAILAPEPGPVGSARISTFNMQWLNDQLNTGIVPRSASDYAAIAQVIESTDSAIIAIQEVENVGAVQNLVISNNLAGKHFNVISTGQTSQEPGIIWNSTLAVVTQLATPGSITGFTRTPLFVSFRVGNFDGVLVVVHLKAGTDTVSKNQRAAEMNNLLSWASSYLAQPSNDPDLIITGDFNFNPSGPEYSIPNTFRVLATSTPTLVSGNDTVDFFITSQDTQEEIVSLSTTVLNTTAFSGLYSLYAVSDHWPVRIEIDGDNPTLDN